MDLIQYYLSGNTNGRTDIVKLQQRPESERASLPQINEISLTPPSPCATPSFIHLLHIYKHALNLIGSSRICWDLLKNTTRPFELVTWIVNICFSYSYFLSFIYLVP